MLHLWNFVLYLRHNQTNQDMAKLILSLKNDLLLRAVDLHVDNDAPLKLKRNDALELELSNSNHSVSAYIGGCCSKIDIDLTSSDRTFIIKRAISNIYYIVGALAFLVLHILSKWSIVLMIVGLVLIVFIASLLVVKNKIKYLIFVEV